MRHQHRPRTVTLQCPADHTFSPSFIICGAQSSTTLCAGFTKKSDDEPDICLGMIRAYFLNCEKKTFFKTKTTRALESVGLCTHMLGGPASRGNEHRSVIADGREGAGQLLSRPQELCEGSRDGRVGAGPWTHPRRQALWHSLSACAVQPAIVLVVLLLLLHGPSCVLSVWPICYDHYVPDKIGTDAGACIS